MKLARLAILLILVFSGCAEEKSPEWQNEDKFDCTGNKVAEEQVISELVPNGQPIESSCALPIDVSGRQSYLVLVNYGKANDCPSGCFYSFVCAVVDGSRTLLHSGDWYNIGEAPVGVEKICSPFDANAGSITLKQCSPEGYKHPITTTAEYKALVQNEEPYPFNRCIIR